MISMIIRKKRKLIKATESTIYCLVFINVLAGCYQGLQIQNPYSQVDWKHDHQYKACLHSHSTRSDGSLSPQSVVDNFSYLGYDILAITDHNKMTYPWDEFATMEASGSSKEKVTTGKLDSVSIIYENREPVQVKMTAIQGSEISSPQHLGCFFTDYCQAAKIEDTTLSAIAARDGLVVFFHPGKYTHPVMWYSNYFTKYQHIIGVEVYNRGNRYPNDLEFWDSLLVKMMPERLIWGFSNDDMHRLTSIGKNWNVFIIPESTASWVYRAMEEGRFFFVLAPNGQDGQEPPVIHSITVSERKSTIRIDASGQDSVRWVSNGTVIHRGETIDLKKTKPDGKYVRAELYGADGTVIGTQPFGMVKY